MSECGERVSADTAASEFVVAAAEGVTAATVEGALVYAMLAVESRIEWLASMVCSPRMQTRVDYYDLDLGEAGDGPEGAWRAIKETEGEGWAVRSMMVAPDS